MASPKPPLVIHLDLNGTILMFDSVKPERDARKTINGYLSYRCNGKDTEFDGAFAEEGHPGFAAHHSELTALLELHAKNNLSTVPTPAYFALVDWAQQQRALGHHVQIVLRTFGVDVPIVEASHSARALPPIPCDYSFVRGAMYRCAPSDFDALQRSVAEASSGGSGSSGSGANAAAAGAAAAVAAPSAPAAHTVADATGCLLHSSHPIVIGMRDDHFWWAKIHGKKSEGKPVYRDVRCVQIFFDDNHPAQHIVHVAGWGPEANVRPVEAEPIEIMKDPSWFVSRCSAYWDSFALGPDGVIMAKASSS